jgi:hypothetical protein
MLVSSIVIEIKILLIDQILDHFMQHPVESVLYNSSCSSITTYFEAKQYSTLLGGSYSEFVKGALLYSTQMFPQ